MIERALIIDEPWIGRILAGDKRWEMRSRKTTIRGRIGLIRKGSGCVVGASELVASVGPLSRDEMLANVDKHTIPESLIRSGHVDKWCWAWVLAEVQVLSRPVSYKHPNGAVIWVNLGQNVSTRIGEMQSCVDAPRGYQSQEPALELLQKKAIGNSTTVSVSPIPPDKPDIRISNHSVPHAKDDETKCETFEEALGRLRTMTTARWRRPNANGHWGIASARYCSDGGN